MTIETAHAPTLPTAHDAGRPVMAAPRVVGLACRNCQRPEPLGPSYVCPACFGPLEVAYDKDAVREAVSREVIEARPPGLWRYLEFLPVDAPPARGLRVGSTPLIRADRLGPALGIDTLWVKDDTRNPTLSFTGCRYSLNFCRSTALWSCHSKVS